MAQDSRAESVTASATPTPPAPAERIVSSSHRLTVGRKLLKYRAECGTVPLWHLPPAAGDGAGAAAAATVPAPKARASVFFCAYTLEQGRQDPARPITFAFNGGPGSSSVWLHLGLLGPRRVASDAFGRPSPPPFDLVDNLDTLLTDSDLVLIDPVGTGHSRMAEGEKETEFHDYQPDIESVGEFIRLYLTRHGRWGSPKYLLGESYGTTRAAGLSEHLQTTHDIHLNGVMLLSLAIDMQTLRFDHANDLPYPLFVPSFAATAWFHKALSEDLQRLPVAEVVQMAEAFALGPYASALLQGTRLAPASATQIATELARLTGLSVAYVQQCQLRVDAHRYFKQLLRDRGQVTGRIDTRFLGTDRDDAGEHFEADPFTQASVGAYAAGIHRVLKEQFGYDADMPYRVHSPLWKTWRWKDFGNRYANVGHSLRQAMQANPHLRVYVGSGYFDLATPHAAADYTLSHLGLRPEQQARVQTSYFEAGHMMYVHAPSRTRLARELRAFVRQR